jgi:hypothetical protein
MFKHPEIEEANMEHLRPQTDLKISFLIQCSEQAAKYMYITSN